jgi:hypothetical protein
LAIFARILLLQNLVQRAAAVFFSVAIGWTKPKISVQRVAICPTSGHRSFWVGGQAKVLLLSVLFLSVQLSKVIPFNFEDRINLIKRLKIRIYPLYIKGLGWVDSGRWTNRQKSTAYFPRVAWAKKGNLFVKHPGRHLV